LAEPKRWDRVPQSQWVALGFVLGLGGGCFALDAYSCTSSADCTSGAEGTCVEDRCAYAADDCDSGLRFSDLAGSLAGECVDEDAAVGSGETGTDGGDESGDSGEPPASCDALDCGPGACIPVDGVPACACDAYHFAIGDPPTACVLDPCEAHRCFFVDADSGDDAGAGTRDDPWRTLGSAVDSLRAQMMPGDHVLLRRGARWGGVLALDGIVGSDAGSIVVGGYGPLADGRPIVAGVTVSNSTYVTVRDLEVDGSGGAMAGVEVTHADNVVILNNDVHDTVGEGIGVHEGAENTVVADNVVRSVESASPDTDKNGISVAHVWWNGNSTDIGDHHFVIDNVYVASAPGGPESTDRGIVVANRDGGGDFKLLGNRISGVVSQPLWVQAEGYAWIAHNDIATDGMPSGTPSQGGWQAGIIVSHTSHNMVLGNRVFGSATAMIVGAGAGDAEVVVRNNTFAGGIAGWTTWLGEAYGTYENNLVVLTDGFAVASPGFGELEPLATRANAYVSTSGCTFAEQSDFDTPIDFAAWQAQGQDADSTCGAVPGVDAMPSVPADATTWQEADFAALTPASDWERCAEPAGARDCDGNRVVTSIPVWTSLPENGGLGWEGPLFVRQRYPIQ